MLTWPDNCVGDLALPEQIHSSELGIHESPANVVQNDSDGMEPVYISGPFSAPASGGLALTQCLMLAGKRAKEALTCSWVSRVQMRQAQCDQHC